MTWLEKHLDCDARRGGLRRLIQRDAPHPRLPVRCPAVVRPLTGRVDPTADEAAVLLRVPDLSLLALAPNPFEAAQRLKPRLVGGEIRCILKRQYERGANVAAASSVFTVPALLPPSWVSAGAALDLRG